MYLWGTIVGFMMALFPCILLHKVFGRRPFLGISNPYMKGGLVGFMVWMMALLVMFVDLRYEIFGFMSGESGGTMIALITHAHFGFITSGIAVEYFAETMEILRKKSGR